MDGPGPIFENSSKAVITGPFDFCTVARSADTPDCRADWPAASTLAGSTDLEEPVTTAAALLKNTARLSSRQPRGAVPFFEPVGNDLSIMLSLSNVMTGY